MNTGWVSGEKFSVNKRERQQYYLEDGVITSVPQSNEIKIILKKVLLRIELWKIISLTMNLLFHFNKTILKIKRKVFNDLC